MPRIHVRDASNSPIKPPIRKQTICAITRSITNTESFLPLRFSIMVPCILLRRPLCYRDSAATFRGYPTATDAEQTHTPCEMTRDADDKQAHVRKPGEIGPSKWKPTMGETRCRAAFAKFRISRDIELSRLSGVAGDVSIPRAPQDAPSHAVIPVS